ncbi:AAA family ATPase, partial [Conexibacter stalactiti]
MTATSERLLERDAEVARLRRALAAATDGAGGVTVLAAPAGLGKTALLEAALAEAAANGLRPLTARAGELEQEFAFGVVRQLVEPAVVAASDEERARLLSGAARRAATVLDLEPDAALDRDVHATLHGLYWLLLNLAADGPLVLAIDDLQWADEPSLRCLAYVARRLEGVPLAIVATMRTEAAGGRVELPDAATDSASAVAATAARLTAIEELLAGPGAERIEPAPLSVEAVAELLERALGRPSEPAFATACRAHTAGNPFLLSEVVAELAAEGVAPTAARAAELERIVPTRVGETLRRHLARLAPDARALAAAVAVLGEGAELPVAAELAALGRARAAVVAAELVGAQVLAPAAAPRFR